MKVDYELKFTVSVVKGRAQYLQSFLSWTIHLRGLAHLNTSLSETKSKTFIILKYSRIPFSLGNREISQVNKSNLHWKKIHPQLKLERPTDNPKVNHIKLKTPNKSQKEKGHEILPREGQFRSIKNRTSSPSLLDWQVNPKCPFLGAFWAVDWRNPLRRDNGEAEEGRRKKGRLWDWREEDEGIRVAMVIAWFTFGVSDNGVSNGVTGKAVVVLHFSDWGWDLDMDFQRIGFLWFSTLFLLPACRSSMVTNSQYRPWDQ